MLSNTKWCYIWTSPVHLPPPLIPPCDDLFPHPPPPLFHFALLLNNLPWPSGGGSCSTSSPHPHPSPPFQSLKQSWRKPVHLPQSISSEVNHHWLTHRLCPPPTATAVENQRRSDSSLCASPSSGWRIWHPEIVKYRTERARPWAFDGEAWCVYEFKSMWSACCTRVLTTEWLFWAFLYIHSSWCLHICVDSLEKPLRRKGVLFFWCFFCTVHIPCNS